MSLRTFFECVIHSIEDYRHKNITKKTVVRFLLSGVVVILAIFLYFASLCDFFLPLVEYLKQIINNVEWVNPFINSASVYIFCVSIIFVSFNIFSDKNAQKIPYGSLHIIFIFVPIALLFQYNAFGTLVIATSLIITLFASIIVYVTLKNIHENHIKKLRFANIRLVIIFTILAALANFYKDGVETKLFLICIAPLIALQIVYEKLLLRDIDKQESENKKTDCSSPST